MCRGMFVGESHAEKLDKLREELRRKDAHAMVVTMLDEIAWLFNMRGSDIDYNPGNFVSMASSITYNYAHYVGYNSIFRIRRRHSR